MSDVDEKTPMTEREIGLVRAIVHWRREQGGTFYLTRGGQGFAGRYGFAEWRSRNLSGPSVAFDRVSPGEISECDTYHGSAYRNHPVESVTQAVDLLCAYGRLPQRFSSAYWNGTMEAIIKVGGAIGGRAEATKDGDLFAMGYNMCHEQVMRALSDLRDAAL